MQPSIKHRLFKCYAIFQRTMGNDSDSDDYMVLCANENDFLGEVEVHNNHEKNSVNITKSIGNQADTINNKHVVFSGKSMPDQEWIDKNGVKNQLQWIGMPDKNIGEMVDTVIHFLQTQNSEKWISVLIFQEVLHECDGAFVVWATEEISKVCSKTNHKLVFGSCIFVPDFEEDWETIGEFNQWVRMLNIHNKMTPQAIHKYLLARKAGKSAVKGTLWQEYLDNTGLGSNLNEVGISKFMKAIKDYHTNGFLAGQDVEEPTFFIPIPLKDSPGYKSKPEMKEFLKYQGNSHPSNDLRNILRQKCRSYETEEASQSAVEFNHSEENVSNRYDEYEDDLRRNINNKRKLHQIEEASQFVGEPTHMKRQVIQRSFQNSDGSIYDHQALEVKASELKEVERKLKLREGEVAYREDLLKRKEESLKDYQDIQNEIIENLKEKLLGADNEAKRLRDQVIDAMVDADFLKEKLRRKEEKESNLKEKIEELEDELENIKEKRSSKKKKKKH